MNYPRLFSPIAIKPGFTLKNRIFMPAIHSGLSEDGKIHKQGVHHVGDIADEGPVNEIAEGPGHDHRH